ELGVENGLAVAQNLDLGRLRRDLDREPGYLRRERRRAIEREPSSLLAIRGFRAIGGFLELRPCGREQAGSLVAIGQIQDGTAARRETVARGELRARLPRSSARHERLALVEEGLRRGVVAV